jgi:hypothetical protein
MFHTPTRQLLGDAREIVAIVLRVADVPRPAGAQQQRFAGLEFLSDLAEMRDRDKRLVREAVEIHDPRPAHAAFERRLVNRARPGGEMRLRVHVRAGVRIQMQRARVPAVALDGLRLLECDSAHAIAQREREVNDASGGAASLPPRFIHHRLGGRDAAFPE